MSKFLDYGETYSMLHERLKAQHIEVQYWARKTAHFPNGWWGSYNTELQLLLPFVSDLPGCDKQYSIPFLPFDPALCFFLKENVLGFTPPTHDRLVLIKDLPGRFWVKELRSGDTTFSDFPALERAAQNGILRFYDPETYKFTYQKKSNGSCPDKLWYHTAEGEKYLAGQNNEFFLLQDIVNIERIFFNRPRRECLEELGFDPDSEDFQ